MTKILTVILALALVLAGLRRLRREAECCCPYHG